MTDHHEEKPIKADCGHYVADHNELAAQPDGRRICPDCNEYGEPAA